MNWTEYGVSLAALVLGFLGTGYFVSPSFVHSRGNLYAQNRRYPSSPYFTTLAVHALLGGLVVTFGFLGLLKTRLFATNERQTALVWTWSLLPAAAWLATYATSIMPAASRAGEPSAAMIEL